MFRAWYFPSVVINFAYVAGSFPASFTAAKWLIFAARMKSSRIQPQLLLCLPALHRQIFLHFYLVENEDHVVVTSRIGVSVSRE